MLPPESEHVQTEPLAEFDLPQGPAQSFRVGLKGHFCRRRAPLDQGFESLWRCEPELNRFTFGKVPGSLVGARDVEHVVSLKRLNWLLPVVMLLLIALLMLGTWEVVTGRHLTKLCWMSRSILFSP